MWTFSLSTAHDVGKGLGTGSHLFLPGDSVGRQWSSPEGPHPSHSPPHTHSPNMKRPNALNDSPASGTHTVGKSRLRLTQRLSALRDNGVCVHTGECGGVGSRGPDVAQPCVMICVTISISNSHCLSCDSWKTVEWEPLG